MNEFTSNIGGALFLDEEHLWKSVSNSETPLSNRLSTIMRRAGVRFWDEDGPCHFVKQPLVAITAIGGFQVSLPEDDDNSRGKITINGRSMTPADIVEELARTTGKTGFYSYLNTGNLDAAKMDAVTSKLGHHSKLHSINLELAIFGYSAGIEGNLMKLRPWFQHISRLTTARTVTQSAPPLVVQAEEDLATARLIRESTSRTLSPETLKATGLCPPSREGLSATEYGMLLADYHERVNSLWPLSRALILGVTADIQNWRGCMGDIGDPGQELEYRRLLAMVNDTLQAVFPDLFQHSSSYGYEMPSHWPEYPQWQGSRDKG